MTAVKTFPSPRGSRRVPDSPWYRIQAAGERAELFIYNDIGQSWFGDGITAEDLVQELAGIKAKALDVRINSNGGSVFDGLGIYNALARFPGQVVTHVDGIAASIASVIAMAGGEVRIAKNAFLMIHNAHGIAFGDAAAMRKMADDLETIGGSLRQIYQDATGQSEEQIRSWMDAETWFNASAAEEAGFVDVVTQDQAIAACFDLSGFQHVPAAAAALATPPGAAPAMTEEDFHAGRRRIRELAASIQKPTRT